MSGRSCVAGLQDVLVEPNVFLSRGTLAKGGSIPCHSCPLPNTCLRFCLYTIYVEREMKLFLLDDYYTVVDSRYYNIKRFLI